MSPTNLAQSARRTPSGAKAVGLRDLGFTFELLGTQEVGFGSVAWLRLGPAASGVRTLARSVRDHGGDASGAQQPMAHAARALHIGETGQVPELEVENREGDPLLLPAHVVLSGGWQTRAVERSIIVPGGGSARVPVKCVEAGRWAPRDDQTARSFQVTDRTGVRTRWSTARSMVDQLTRHGRFAAEQSAVWQQVDEELTRCAVASRTRSYEAYLEGVKRRLVGEARRAAVRPPPAANGVAIFPRGGGFWVEAYPSPDALAEHADNLLANLFDATGHGGVGEVLGPLQTMTRAPDVDALVNALEAAPLRPLDPIAGTIGETYAFGEGAEAAGAVLLVDGALAHVAVGAAPPEGERWDTSGNRRRGAPSKGPALESMDRVVATSPSHPQAAPPSRPAEPAVASPAPSRWEPAASAPPASAPAERGSASISASGQGSEGSIERPRVGMETMRGIFGRARDLLPEGPPARERVQGYRLVRVLDRNISWIDVRIGGDGYAVLGSHDRCDLVLSNDAGIWLRHLAAICVRLEDGSVGLRLIDLKTDLPFFLDDDTARWSVIARGPFAMRLGRHVVCGFPIGPAAGEGAAASASAGASRGSPSPIGSGRAGEGAPTTAIHDELVQARSVVAAPSPNDLAQFIASAPVSQIHDLLGPSNSTNLVRVTLERGGMGASVELPTQALDAGVLLGRALNCFDGGLRRIFCEAISRAHVLLVRDHEDVFAFDLCSTNGTRVAGQRIRRYRLSDAGSTLELGKKVSFRWHRRDPRPPG